MPPESPTTLFLLRCTALLAALRDGPLARPDLLARLGDAYPAPQARAQWSIVM